jgi:hypothetical protein
MSEKSTRSLADVSEAEIKQAIAKMCADLNIASTGPKHNIALAIFKAIMAERKKLLAFGHTLDQWAAEEQAKENAKISRR